MDREKMIEYMTQGGISVCSALLNMLEEGKDKFEELSGEDARKVMKMVIENQKYQFLEILDNK